MQSRFSVRYGSTPVGQFSIASTAPDVGGLLRLKAAAPLKPRRPQEPCDLGLFSDAPRQLDLIDLARK